MPKIKSIRDIPLGKIEFKNWERANEFPEELINRGGYFFYREKGISNPEDAFVLFRYKAKIFAHGIIRKIFNENNNPDRFKELQDKYLEPEEIEDYKGVYRFYTTSIKSLEHPIEKYEINLLAGCSEKVFGRSPNIYPMEALKDLNELLNSKSSSYIVLSKENSDEIPEIEDTRRKAIPATRVKRIHEKMKEILKGRLRKKYREEQIDVEREYVDIFVKNTNYRSTLYELKTDDTAEKCIRKALGQMLYYNWVKEVENTDKNHEIKLVVWGLYKFQNEKKEFLKFIQKKFKADIKYYSFEEVYGKKFVQNLKK